MLRRIQLGLALAVGGLVIGLVLAEVGVRLVRPVQEGDLLPISYDHEALRRITSGDAYLRFDRELGWAPAPATARSDGSVTYQANAAGMRSEREYSIEPPPGMRRLAAFGDSFTHCDEVNNRDCWTAQLERTWAGTEVLNFGVPGYGPDQSWLRYQRDGQPYRPCAVLIGYLIENVNRVVNRFRPFYAPEDGIALSKPRFVLRGDELVLLPNPAPGPESLGDPHWVEDTLGPHDYWYFPGMFVESPLDSLQVVRVARSAAYRRDRRQKLKAEDRNPFAPTYRGRHEGYVVAGRVLVEFARQVRQDGATPVVVVFTARRDLASARAGDKFYAPLIEWLERESIPTIDLTNVLEREVQRGGVDAVYASDGHYRRSGNQIVATTLTRQLPELIGGTCAVS